MNLVGKILTGLIALFSVLFMAFALAVYAAHTNWKNKVMDPQSGLQAQLDKEKKNVKDLNAQVDKLKQDLDAERKALVARVKSLEDEKGRLQTERAKQEKDLAALDQKWREATGAVTAASVNVTGLAEQVKQLRDNIRAAEKKQNEDFDKMKKMTDQMHQLASDLGALKGTNQTLVADLQKYRKVLDLFGLKGDPELYTKVAPPVDGHVVAVSEPGAGLIELSVGSDLGIEKGQTLEVYRRDGNAYLGRVEIVSTEPDKSVAKILPNLQRGAIQKGDRIASRLQ